MAKKASQIDHYEHSAIKLKLLKNYLKAYLSVIGHSPYYKVVHLYDLFCGEGLYPNEGKGSPLIITETIREIQERSSNSNLNSTQFHFTANDIDEESYLKVKDYFENNSEQIEWLSSLRIENGDYKDYIPILSEKFPRLSGEKAFVFIDPYGYRDISVTDIKALLKGGNSEVLLFLPTQFMYRFDNHAAPDSLVKFISELDPDNNWRQTESGLEFIEQLNNSFSQYLGDDFYVDSFVIAKAKNEYFCLFFFTSHIYGFEKMLEAKWRIDEEEGRGWKPSSYVRESEQMDMFETVKKTAYVDPLESALMDYIVDWKTNNELYEFTLNHKYLPKHINAILKRFESEDKIEIEAVNDIKVRKSSYYINFSNFNSRVPKIRLRVKSN